MSGGSYNYTYSQVQDMAEELQRSRSPMRRTFGNHLLKVAEALHDIEWVDSGDYGDGDDLKAIQAVLGAENMETSMLVEVKRDIEEQLKEIDKIVHAEKKQKSRSMRWKNDV